jgi:hypothetical protein
MLANRFKLKTFLRRLLMANFAATTKGVRRPRTRWTVDGGTERYRESNYAVLDLHESGPLARQTGSLS